MTFECGLNASNIRLGDTDSFPGRVQRFNRSQPKNCNPVRNDSHTLDEQYLRVHLRGSIKAAADHDGNTNLLPDELVRRILLGHHDLPARYTALRQPVQMVHPDHLHSSRPNQLRERKIQTDGQRLTKDLRPSLRRRSARRLCI